MRVLSNQFTQLVSGGAQSEYDASASVWAFAGLCIATANTGLIPVSYREYFTVFFVFINAGAIAGYAFGVGVYYASKSIQSSLDQYLSPEQ